MRIPMLLRPARAAQRSEVREVCRITPLARTQTARCRRLALATGFRLLRLSGINRIAAQWSVAGRGWAGPDRRGFDNHRRIFDACPERVEGAAMIFKLAMGYALAVAVRLSQSYFPSAIVSSQKMAACRAYGARPPA